MLTKALFVQVGCAFHFAMVVALVLGVLVDLKRSLTGFRHVCAHECCSVHLELSTLGLHLKLIISVKSRSVFFKDTGLCIDSGSLIGSRSGRDLKARSWPLTAEENGLIGLECGALRAYFSLFTEEGSLVFLVTLTFHVARDDVILDFLELITDGISWVDLALVASIEEFVRGCLIL